MTQNLYGGKVTTLDQHIDRQENFPEILEAATRIPAIYWPTDPESRHGEVLLIPVPHDFNRFLEATRVLAGYLLQTGHFIPYSDGNYGEHPSFAASAEELIGNLERRFKETSRAAWDSFTSGREAPYLSAEFTFTPTELSGAYKPVVPNDGERFLQVQAGRPPQPVKRVLTLQEMQFIQQVANR